MSTRSVNISSSDLTQATALNFLPQQQEIELALSAGPEHLRLDASVYVFGKKGYEKIRSGRNGFTCMVNRDGNQKRRADPRSDLARRTSYAEN